MCGLRILLQALVLWTVISSASAAQPLPFILDMVHYNPGEAKFQTEFADPALVRSYGFNGKVFYLFDSAHLAVNWDDVNANIFPAGSSGRAWVDA